MIGLTSSGPAFGYFLQPSICMVAPTGHRFLGGYIGDLDDLQLRQNFLLQKVNQWSCHARILTAVASIALCSRTRNIFCWQN